MYFLSVLLPNNSLIFFLIRFEKGNILEINTILIYELTLSNDVSNLKLIQILGSVYILVQVCRSLQCFSPRYCAL